MTYRESDVVSRYIVSDSSRHGGRPFIAGSEVLVQYVYEWHEILGLSAETIARATNLSLAKIYSALAFAHEYPSSIETLLTQDQDRGWYTPTLQP